MTWRKVVGDRKGLLPWRTGLGPLVSDGANPCKLMRSQAAFAAATDKDAGLLHLSFRLAADGDAKVLDEITGTLGHRIPANGYTRTRQHVGEVLGLLASGKLPLPADALAMSTTNALLAGSQLLKSLKRPMLLHADLQMAPGATGVRHEPHPSVAFVPFDDDWWHGFDNAIRAATLDRASDEPGLLVRWRVDLRPLWDLSSSFDTVQAFGGIGDRSVSGAFALLVVDLLSRLDSRNSRLPNHPLLPPLEQIALTAVINADGTFEPVNEGTIGGKLASLGQLGNLRAVAWAKGQRIERQYLQLLPSEAHILEPAETLPELVKALCDHFGPRRFGPRLSPLRAIQQASTSLHPRPRLLETIRRHVSNNESGYLHLVAPADWGKTSFLRWWQAAGPPGLVPVAAATQSLDPTATPWSVLLDLQHHSRMALGLPFDPPREPVSFRFNGNETEQTLHFQEFLQALGPPSSAAPGCKKVLLIDDAERLIDQTSLRLHAALGQALPAGVFVVLVTRSATLPWLGSRPDSLLHLDLGSNPDVKAESDEIVGQVVDQTACRWETDSDQASATALTNARDAVIARACGFLLYALELRDAAERSNPAQRLELLKNLPGLDKLLAEPLARLWQSATGESEAEIRLTAAALAASLRDPTLTEHDLAWLAFGEQMVARPMVAAPECSPRQALAAFRLGTRDQFRAALRAGRELRGAQATAGSTQAVQLGFGHPRQQWLAQAALALLQDGGGWTVPPLSGLAQRIADRAADAGSTQGAASQLHATLAALCENALAQPAHADTPPAVRRYAASWGLWHLLQAMPQAADEAAVQSMVGRLLDPQALEHRVALREAAASAALRAWHLTVGLAELRLPGQAPLMRAAARVLRQWEPPLLARQLSFAASLHNQLGGWASAAPYKQTWLQALRSADLTLHEGGQPRAEMATLHGVQGVSFSACGGWMVGIMGREQVAVWRVRDESVEPAPFATWVFKASAVRCVEAWGGPVVVALGVDGLSIHLLRWIEDQAKITEIGLPPDIRSPLLWLLAEASQGETLHRRVVLCAFTAYQAHTCTLTGPDNGPAAWRRLAGLQRVRQHAAAMHVTAQASDAGSARLLAGTATRRGYNLLRFDWQLQSHAPADQIEGDDVLSLPSELAAITALAPSRYRLTLSNGCQADWSFGDKVAEWQPLGKPALSIETLDDGRLVMLGDEGRVSVSLRAGSGGTFAPLDLGLDQPVKVRHLAAHPKGRLVALCAASPADATQSVTLLLGPDHWSRGDLPAPAARPVATASSTHLGAVWTAICDAAGRLQVFRGHDPLLDMTVGGIADNRPTAIAWGKAGKGQELFVGGLPGNIWRLEVDGQLGSCPTLEPICVLGGRIQVLAAGSEGSIWAAVGATEARTGRGSLHRMKCNAGHWVHEARADGDITSLCPVPDGVMFGDSSGSLMFCPSHGQPSRLLAPLPGAGGVAVIAACPGPGAGSGFFVITSAGTCRRILLPVAGEPGHGAQSVHEARSPIGAPLHMQVLPGKADSTAELWIWNAGGVARWRPQANPAEQWAVCPLPDSAPPVVGVHAANADAAAPTLLTLASDRLQDLALGSR